MDRTPFRFCPRCHAKYPYTDQHLVCNLCLSPDHREETCEACRSFRSKKTLRDRRARRLEMASRSNERLDAEEEELVHTAVSVRGSDSEQESDTDRPITAGQHVSTLDPTPSKPKYKASGTPLPEGHGSTRKKDTGDQATSSAPKKAIPTTKPSVSNRGTGSEIIRHRPIESKPRKSLSEPRTKSTPGPSVPKKPASEPKKRTYTEEHGLSKQLKESHRFEEELTQMEDFDHKQARIQIHKDTGKILTAPPLRTKRKLAFHGHLDTDQPKAKVPKTREKSPSPQFSPQQSPPHSPQLTVSPPATPTAQSPTHTMQSQHDIDPWDL